MTYLRRQLTKKSMSQNHQQQEKLSAYFQLKCNDALKTAKKMTSMGEYLWAKDWERYAREIHAYGLQYEREAAYARRMKKPEPALKMPLQPANLSSVRTVQDGQEVEIRRQLHRGYKRPSNFQCIGI